MSEAAEDLDGVGGGFDLDGLKKKYRRRDAASKPRHALAAIEHEILEEIACQSGRYGDRLEALLAEMKTLRCSIEGAMAQCQLGGKDDPRVSTALSASMVRYNQLRVQAQQVQHYLIIHREAMGFWNHDDVFRCYPIPAPLTPLSSTHIPKLPAHP